MAMLLSAARPRPKPVMQDTLREPPPMATPAMGASPRDIEIRKLLARDLMQAGGSGTPVKHWLEGVNRIADGALGAFQDYSAKREEREGRKGASDAWAKVMAETDPQKRTAAALALAENPWLGEGARAATGAMVANEFRPPTDDQREYQAAKAEGFPGSFMDYQTTLRMAGAGYQPGSAPGTFAPAPGGPADPSMKPPPPAVQTKEDEDIDAIGASNSMNATIDDITKRIDDKKLDLGFFTNWINYGRNVAGASTPESVEYAAFDQSLKKMQNDILILHNGVQTEGDAIRALQQIVTNPTDTEVVKRNLSELKKLNERALSLRKQKIDLRRERNKMAPIDPADLGLPAPVTTAPSPPVSGPPQFAPTGPEAGAAPAAPQGGPQPGTIEDGMRFRGGDPSKPESWEPVAPTGPAGGPEMSAPPPGADPVGFAPTEQPAGFTPRRMLTVQAPANGRGMAPPETLAQIGRRGPQTLSPQMADIEHARAGLTQSVDQGGQQYLETIARLKAEWKRDKAKVMASPEYQMLKQSGLLYLLDG